MEKGIIFDMDGTLFDSESIWRDMWRYLPKEYGMEEDLTLGEDMCGTCGSMSEQVAKAHFPMLDEVEFVRRGRAKYVERILAKQPPEKPGMRECIRYFKENGYRLAIASGSPLRLIQINVKRAGLEQYFDVMVSGDDVKKGKPDPDVFLEAARRMGCKPENCYVVEDGTNGILGAAAAGCKPIMVPDLTDPTEDIKKICRVYSSLLDLVDSKNAREFLN